MGLNRMKPVSILVLGHSRKFPVMLLVFWPPGVRVYLVSETVNLLFGGLIGNFCSGRLWLVSLKLQQASAYYLVPAKGLLLQTCYKPFCLQKKKKKPRSTPRPTLSVFMSFKKQKTPGFRTTRPRRSRWCCPKPLARQPRSPTSTRTRTSKAPCLEMVLKDWWSTFWSQSH